MSARTASDLSLGELKDELRKLGLSTSGKSELIIRLNRVNPSGIWTEKLPEEQEARSTEDMTTNEGNITRIQAQLEKYSHDRRVLEEELNTRQLRQELESLRAGTARASGARIEEEPGPTQSKVSINAIAELLVTFDGTMGNFETWEKQLRLVRRTYRLSDEHTKLLIGMRLKGKALEWLHSKPQFLEISVKALLCELKTMFDHRPSRMKLRKDFEEREWKKGETFSDYVHQKVILGNRILIDEDEIAEYIDGIPDRMLRDQAHVRGLKTKTALLEAFDRITLRDKKYHERIRRNSTRERRG